MSRYGRISLSLMNCQIIRVISSPSSSTTGVFTLILAMVFGSPGRSAAEASGPPRSGAACSASPKSAQTAASGRGGRPCLRSAAGVALNCCVSGVRCDALPAGLGGWAESTALFTVNSAHGGWIERSRSVLGARRAIVRGLRGRAGIAHRPLAAERERRHELDPVAAPEPARVVPRRRPAAGQQAHVLVRRGDELGAVHRLERRGAPEAPVAPLAREAEGRGERAAVEARDRLHEAVLVAALEVAALERAHPRALAVALVPGRRGVGEEMELHAAVALAAPHVGERAPELGVPEQRGEVV